MPKKYQPHDRYFEKAKQEGYRARSVYKLREIQEKFHLVSEGGRVLDLGAAPGSFMQYLLRLVGPKGVIVGIDLQEIKPLDQPNVHTFVCDIFDEQQLKNFLKNFSSFDLITSDLAPATSGIKSLDAGRSFQLSERVLEIAQAHLRPGGRALIKFFPGGEQGDLLKKAKTLFEKVSLFQPKAVRESSREQYLIGQEKKESPA